MEGEKYYAPRRPEPPLPGKRPAPPVEVAEPQARLGQHSGIGHELVLALVVPVLQMAEQLVEEAEEEALAVEYVGVVERLREVVRRRHVLRQKGRGRKEEEEEEEKASEVWVPTLSSWLWTSL